MTLYSPLERYGLIGNLETCALVNDEGEIEWLPLPHVESPSVFTSVLDAENGGFWRIQPTDSFDSEQSYLDGTNVLRTTFETNSGRVRVTDFMPVRDDGMERAVYREVTAVEGGVELELTFVPRFDYARAESVVESADGGIRVSDGEYPTDDAEFVFLAGGVGFEVDGATVRATWSLSADESTWFVLSHEETGEADPDVCSQRLDRTVDFWRDWAHSCPDGCSFDGVHHDLAVRSGLVLKLLTHRETGAICAAPTTSLPENVGGVRNWDYRYNWIRDAAFTIQALANLGHTAEAESYFDWFLNLSHAEHPTQLQPLYGLHGAPDLQERTLDHLSGYRDSSPVRVGNAAKDQQQLDIFGELLLAIFETTDGDEFNPHDWGAIRGIVEHVCDVWDDPDAGIWEVRGGPRHFVHSKVMCWVALDRGLRIADEWGFDAPTEKWEQTRDLIRGEILERGYDDDVGSFVQSYGSKSLDATALLIPIVGFLPFEDDRVQNTIDAVRDRLEADDDGLVRRYDGTDGLPGEEGAFVICSFWLVSALALSGRVEEARDVFESVCDHASPLGLFAEEIDPETGELLGNYPQAFSHVGLVNAALYLGMAEREEVPYSETIGGEQQSDDLSRVE
ncbi:glycoside hydrolase family 15 protein (plasmid) [Haladaptatus sp. SPP-AMP-3]|uniref:glycoside hydrolase family 15 protein n=1 Tax=Haladaptatus sp. SPP-AMP-3 TaxID=3121295 RepID=UPI003C301350